MVDSDDLYGPMEVDDLLSTALGTETLAVRDMVPPGLLEGNMTSREEQYRQLQQLGGSEVAEYLNRGLIVHCRVYRIRKALNPGRSRPGRPRPGLTP